MSNSTPTYDAISESQSGKAVTANQYFDAASPSTFFGRRGSTCSGLTWGYYGATMLVDGVLTQIANGTLALTASSTNYIEATRAGVISKNVVGFTPGAIPLYQAVVGAATVTSYTDYRAWIMLDSMTSKATGVVVTTADVTLSNVQARCEYCPVTGALTAARAIIVPNDWRGIIHNQTSGAFTLTVKTLAGTGIVVAQGMKAMLFADGTNVLRLTGDI